MEQARIMVVDDEGIIALDIKRRLERIGYNVSSVCYSGDEAVKQASQTLPDLVLMDIRMPGEIDGIGAATQIREKHNIPVVFVTAYSDEVTLERAKVTEPFGYVLKPVQDRDLCIACEIALYRHMVESELSQRLREVTGLNNALQQQLKEASLTTEVLRDFTITLSSWRQEVDMLIEQAKSILKLDTIGEEKPADDERNDS